jgi:hypothetical protein
MEGFLEALPPGEGLLDKKQHIIEVLTKMGESSWLDFQGRNSIVDCSVLFHTIISAVFKTGLESEVILIFFGSLFQDR